MIHRLIKRYVLIQLLLLEFVAADEKIIAMKRKYAQDNNRMSARSIAFVSLISCIEKINSNETKSLHRMIER
ncbi:MAG: hypothetical protein ABI840_11275 [bacterium]